LEEESKMPEVVIGFGEQTVLEFYHSFLNRESYPGSRKLAAACREAENGVA
jgi:hypothetical protein